MGSRICKIKHLITTMVKKYKTKKISDSGELIFYLDKKYFDVEFVKPGGWHFTNVTVLKKLIIK